MRGGARRAPGASRGAWRRPPGPRSPRGCGAPRRPSGARGRGRGRRAGPSGAPRAAPRRRPPRAPRRRRRGRRPAPRSGPAPRFATLPWSASGFVEIKAIPEESVFDRAPNTRNAAAAQGALPGLLRGPSEDRRALRPRGQEAVELAEPIERREGQERGDREIEAPRPLLLGVRVVERALGPPRQLRHARERAPEGHVDPHAAVDGPPARVE